ncbi:MAG TPA: glycosyltransferase family 87 protein [Trichormus sp.]
MNERIKTACAVIFAAFSVAVAIFLMCMNLGVFAQVSDLPEFYAAARMVLAGQGKDVYVLAAQQMAQNACFPALGGRITAFFVNPISFPLLVPLGWVPVSIVIYVWKALQFIAAGVAFWLIKKSFELDLRGLMWLIAVTMCSGAAFESVRLDQLGMFLLLGISLATWGLKQDRPIIAALGLSILFLKPQELLPLLAFLLGARRYKVLLYLVVLGFIFGGIAMLEIGVDGLVNYKQLMMSTADSSQFLQTHLSPSLRGQLFRLFPLSKTLLTIITGVIYFAALGLFAWCGNLFSKSHKWIEAGLICAMPLGMVLSPYFFDYDLLILMPSLVVLTQKSLQDRLPPWAILSCMFGGFIFMLPFSFQIHYDYLMKGGLWNPSFIALLLFGIGCLVVALKHKTYFDEYV